MSRPKARRPSAKKRHAAEILRKHREYLWPAVVHYYARPLVAARARMQHVWDIEGKKYLDFFGGIVTIGVGHCNPKITSRISQQIRRLQHTSTLYPNEAIVALAERLARIAPGKLRKSFFTNSGTEANEAAILLARMARGSYDVIALRHGYAGASALAKSVTGQAAWRRAGVINTGISHALSPYCYRCPLRLTYPDCGVACANDVENVIQTTTNGAPAAFIAEPIQGVGGFITPPAEYFKIVHRIVKNYGGLFISDEVQTGLGRTGGKWFGIEQWGVVPDVITCAKSLGNGVPIGATTTTPELAAKFQGLTISTFGGNPVTCAAAGAVIDLVEKENLRENARVVGGYLRARLEGLKEQHPLIGDVRGMGLMQALELVSDRASKQPAPKETDRLLALTRANGLLVGKGGLYGNVIRIAPPMNISKTDVDHAVRMLDTSLRQIRD